MIYIDYLTNPYYDSASALLNDYLSFGLSTPQKLKELANSQQAIIALANSEVVGICTYEPFQPTKHLFQHQDILDLLPDDKEIMCLKQSVVTPLYRNQGIGSQLVEKALSFFPSHVFIAFGWLTPHGCESEGILKANGFQLLMKRENFWLQDSLENSYGCPYCGEIGCKCPALILFKDSSL